jgi:glycosyltransferase involved in cell wall biosynthesis
MPRVSLIMPVRDAAAWLAQAIASIKAQSLADFELIIVDDGSVDASAELADASARGDPRIRVIRQGKLGLVAALNRGLGQAGGELIARLDADDRAHPQRLKRQVDYLDQHPDVGLLGTWADKIDENGAPCGVLEPPAEPDVLAALLPRTNPFVHSSVMLRGAVLRQIGSYQVGPYRSAFEGAEDYDLWLRVAEVAKIANLPERLLQYRWHGASATHRAGVRQLFSTRLAQRAALARRRDGRDPAAGLTAPPDWRAAESLNAPLYADLVPLYRLLDLADRRDLAGMSGADLDLAVLRDRKIVLTHAERRMAQLALVNLLRQGVLPARTSYASLLLQLVRLHPLRALRLGVRSPRR